MAAAFREDIDVAHTRCTPDLTCTIPKALPGALWDQLLSPAGALDVVALDVVLDLDQTLMEPDLPTVDDSYDELVVPYVSTAAIDAALAAGRAVVLDARYPWCPSCGYMRGLVSDVARALHGVPAAADVVVGWTNLRAERQLRRRIETATCSDHCVLWVFRPGGGPVVELGIDPDPAVLARDIVFYYTRPALELVEDASALAAFAAARPHALVGSFPPVGVDAEGDAAFAAFHRFAARHRSPVPVAALRHPAVTRELMAVTLYRDGAAVLRLDAVQLLDHPAANWTRALLMAQRGVTPRTFALEHKLRVAQAPMFMVQRGFEFCVRFFLSSF
jgi:hypothetical protein